MTVSPRPWLSHRVIAGGPGRWHDCLVGVRAGHGVGCGRSVAGSCHAVRMGNVGPASMGGDMRKLIVSSLVSLDGIYGDPQSWAGDYAPAR